jgi:signal transduction histidine kinase
MRVLVFGAGAATGLHLGLLHLYLWHSWLAPVTFVTSSLLFAGVSYWMWRDVYPRLPGRTFGRQLVAQTVVSVLVFLALSAVVTSVVAWATGAPPLFGPVTGADKWVVITPHHRQSFVRLYALLPIVPSVLMTLIAYHQVWQHVLALQVRERELRELAATAQLAALRAQINPHFLFNSLNSIAQLIHTDPDKAEACVERLADIFRYLLRRAEKEFVPLAEELEMTEAYLDIERARFDDRLRVETTVDPRSLRRLIPNLILQPLVENAVKHGLSRKLGRGTVRIDARVEGPDLMLCVGDDGVGMAGSVLASVYERGVGLRNLRERMARLYGPSHLPEITSAPGGGTQVRLRLPARAEAA